MAINRILHGIVKLLGPYLAVNSVAAAGARPLRSSRLRTCAATFVLLSCLFFAADQTASAQFQIVGPAPVSATVARQRIRTLLENVNPGNRQETIQDIFGLVNWYRDLLDEELIAAWKKDGRANLTEVMEPLADARVAAGVIEYSWRQQPQATFTPAYAPMLGHLMARYPDSAKPFFDDLLGSPAAGPQALALSPPEVEAVCRILLDLPDIRNFKRNALQILPRYRRDAESLLDRDLHGDDRDRRDRVAGWLADLRVAAPTASSVPAAFKATNAAGSEPARARPGNDTSGGQPAGANPRPASAGAGAMGSDGVYRAGNGVSQPRLVSKVEPRYSETARKLITEGTVVLQIVVQPDGTARDFRVMRSVGYGLDEKAIEAVRQWRFNPGMKDGNAVPVAVTIEINFSLLMKRFPDRWASGPMTFALEAGVTRPVVEDGSMPKPVPEVGDESVVLAFTVDSNGSVKNIHSVHGSQSSSELLTRSLTNWKFQPAMNGGRSVEATGTVLFTKGNGDEAGNRGSSPSPQTVAANGANSARPSILAEEDASGVTHAPAPPGISAGPGSGDPVIQGAREAARQYFESLPNFAAKRFTNRYKAHGDRSSWQALDAVGADVIFENGKESYRNTQVSGKPPGDGVAPPASWSTGEMASLLQSLMAPQTNAVFSNQRPVTIVNRAAFRYDFSVEQPNSHWTVIASSEPYTPAYAGSIWIDQEDQRVLRMEMAARNLPGSFALAAVESEVDYDYVPIGGRKFLLPVHSEMLTCARATGDCIRNVVTFQNYEKFGADENSAGGSAGSGPGKGGGIVGSVYRPGNGVSAPVVTFKTPPEYSQEAQNARLSGTVVLSVVVDPEGYARNIQVVEPLGMGLDQKAIEAVQKWRFRPGYKDGQAVNVFMQVEVGFRVQ
jgi:TonB family protein